MKEQEKKIKSEAKEEAKEELAQKQKLKDLKEEKEELEQKLEEKEEEHEETIESLKEDLSELKDKFNNRKGKVKTESPFEEGKAENAGNAPSIDGQKFVQNLDEEQKREVEESAKKAFLEWGSN